MHFLHGFSKAGFIHLLTAFLNHTKPEISKKAMEILLVFVCQPDRIKAIIDVSWLRKERIPKTVSVIQNVVRDKLSLFKILKAKSVMF